MHPKRIRKSLALFSLAFAAHAASGQVVAPGAGAQAPAAAPVQNLTLRDMAQLAHDAEVKKLRDAQKEAALAEKKAAQTAGQAGSQGGMQAGAGNEVLSVQARPSKPKKRPDIPEGLQVRAIFGVAPTTYVRFYTASGEFHDRLVGQTVQDWKLVRIADGIVTMQKGKVTYPIALQMRSAQSLEQEGSQAPGNMIMSAPLPDPRVVGIVK